MATFEGMVIFCADINASARFYEEGLGLERDWSDDQHIGFHLPTKGDPRGGWLLLHPQTAGENRPHSIGTFTVDDVDAAITRFRDAGFEVTEEPHDEPWGVRQGSVNDTDGYGVTLTAPIAQDAAAAGSTDGAA